MFSDGFLFRCYACEGANISRRQPGDLEGTVSKMDMMVGVAFQEADLAVTEYVAGPTLVEGDPLPNPDGLGEARILDPAQDLTLFGNSERELAVFQNKGPVLDDQVSILDKLDLTPADTARLDRLQADAISPVRLLRRERASIKWKL